MMASVPHHPIFESLWDSFEKSHFKDSRTECTINTRLTFTVVDYLNKRRLTNNCYEIQNIRFLSQKYISNDSDTQPIFAVHHFFGSWKDKTRLTFWQFQWFIFKFRLLRVFSVFMGNKSYIRINDNLWKNALKLTFENIEKGRKIYKVL